MIMSKNSTKLLKDKLKSSMLKAMPTNSTQIIIYLTISILSTLLILIFYNVVIPFFSFSSKSDCIRFTKNYGTINDTIKSIPNDNKYNNNLSDFYIKSAYNCCNGGLYSKGYVSLCVLETIIAQGVRALDFEIYSSANKPIVASSILENTFNKQTYNHVDFTDVVTTINAMAFSENYCNNSHDPIIINLRIKTNNSDMFNTLASTIKMFGNHLLGESYSYETINNNIGQFPLSLFKNKVIIVIHPYKSDILSNNEMKKITNAHTNSLENRLLKNNNIVSDLNYALDELKYFNSRHLSFIIPDQYSNRPSKQENPDFNKCSDGGCQMVFMVYNKNDKHLQENHKMFDKCKSAFCLKDKSLLYTTQSKIYENVTKPIIYRE
jgi:hypothetical protein